MKNDRMLVIVAAGLLAGACAPSVMADEVHDQWCSDKYMEEDTCPAPACELKCPEGTDPAACFPRCVAKACADIPVGQCPREVCSVVEDCAKKKACADKVPLPINCGGLSYAGQEVACCDGFVKRCGIEFLDGTCDMEAKKTAYSLPICLPCGDGVCGQFENRCNCPEDCQWYYLKGE